MRVIYSFNKKGFEEQYWLRELACRRGDDEIIPFNHGRYFDCGRAMRAQLLDNLYFARDASLMALYDHVEKLIAETGADCLVVDNALPYHPEFLRRLGVYKVMRTTDGPISAYDRDFAYCHGYDHVVYHSPAYSPELNMAEKLAYVGAKRADFWPLAAFDEMFHPERSETELFDRDRDIDIIFVGGMFLNKMPVLAGIKKAFGRRAMLRGLSNFKANAYFNLKYGFPGWVRPIPFEEYVTLYQRAKIGINVHNRGKYTIGNYRLFDLPANGVMQICDGDEYLADYYRVGEEVVGYSSTDELIDKVRYYLDNGEERERIARNGYRRVLASHRIRTRLHELLDLLGQAIAASSSRTETAQPAVR
ncbi:glycosyltransferase [Sphingosinicella sp. LHD-64]|uniref:CgeB family protein n=1 Tax=Sphingosinicella sp. LHD-64 TaxID=3072139 RepID=UPI00280C6012|nr:glycosyltransferase [Sphingosinicella sp. LHD-64]MDQ8757221.1 glycosyltransferase [Sphingosinicella sp. LHD-64]